VKGYVIHVKKYEVSARGERQAKRSKVGNGKTLDSIEHDESKKEESAQLRALDDKK
jgi:hypothetical protein